MISVWLYFGVTAVAWTWLLGWGYWKDKADGNYNDDALIRAACWGLPVVGLWPLVLLVPVAAFVSLTTPGYWKWRRIQREKRREYIEREYKKFQKGIEP